MGWRETFLSRSLCKRPKKWKGKDLIQEQRLIWWTMVRWTNLWVWKVYWGEKSEKIWRFLEKWSVLWIGPERPIWIRFILNYGNKSFFDDGIILLFLFAFLTIMRILDNISILIDIFSWNHIFHVLVLVVSAGVVVCISHIVDKDVMNFFQDIVSFLAKVDADCKAVST